MENDWLLGKYQRNILQVFFNNPNVSYSLRDLARRAQVDPGNTKRYVEKLAEEKDLLIKEKSKNKVFISPKYSNPMVRKVFEGFEVRRTMSFLEQDEDLKENMLFLTDVLTGLDSLLMVSLCGFRRDETALQSKRLYLLMVKTACESELEVQKAIDGLCEDYGVCFHMKPKIIDTAEFEESLKRPEFISDFWSDRVVLHGESYLWRMIMRLRKPVEKAQSKAEAVS